MEEKDIIQEESSILTLLKAMKKGQYSTTSPSFSSVDPVTLEDKKRRLERWEAVFFPSVNEKHEFENYFAKNIYEVENDLYMSWLPLKLGLVRGDISTFKKQKCISNITSTK